MGGRAVKITLILLQQNSRNESGKDCMTVMAYLRGVGTRLMRSLSRGGDELCRERLFSSRVTIFNFTFQSYENLLVRCCIPSFDHFEPEPPMTQPALLPPTLGLLCSRGGNHGVWQLCWGKGVWNKLSRDSVKGISQHCAVIVKPRLACWSSAKNVNFRLEPKSPLRGGAGGD
jgi:hypothetical protein